MAPLKWLWLCLRSYRKELERPMTIRERIVLSCHPCWMASSHRLLRMIHIPSKFPAAPRISSPNCWCQLNNRPRDCRHSTYCCAWSSCFVAMLPFWQNQLAIRSPGCDRAQTAKNCRWPHAIERIQNAAMWLELPSVGGCIWSGREWRGDKWLVTWIMVSNLRWQMGILEWNPWKRLAIDRVILSFWNPLSSSHLIFLCPAKRKRTVSTALEDDLWWKLPQFESLAWLCWISFPAKPCIVVWSPLSLDARPLSAHSCRFGSSFRTCPCAASVSLLPSTIPPRGMFAHQSCNPWRKAGWSRSANLAVEGTLSKVKEVSWIKKFFRIDSSRHLRSPSSLVTWPLYSGTYGLKTSFIRTYKNPLLISRSNG